MLLRLRGGRIFRDGLLAVGQLGFPLPDLSAGPKESFLAVVSVDGSRVDDPWVRGLIAEAGRGRGSFLVGIGHVEPYHGSELEMAGKHRGPCPSCASRRMCNEAAMLVDRILPNVPVRQWVMSLPFELRALAAKRSDVLAEMERIFAEEIARVTTRLASIAGARTGSVGFPQRFGSSLNVHVHFHTLAIDGVFEKTASGVRFHEAPPPSKGDVGEVARRVRKRALLWLRRRGYLDERAAEERSNETVEPSALDACTQLALAGGAFLARPFEPKDNPDAALERRERRFSAACDGFDVHCAMRIAADDDQGHERLVRYCTRPAFALDRIEVLPDGRIAYLLKTPRRGRTHRVMSPMEFMARLAALIPPPKIPLVRY
jgi:hypothetical protein